MALPDRDFGAALFAAELGCFRGKMITNLCKGNLAAVDGGPIVLLRSLAVRPARRDEYLPMTARIEPVPHPRVLVRDDGPDHTIRVNVTLETVSTPNTICVLDGLTPEITQLTTDILRAYADGILDDESLSGV